MGQPGYNKGKKVWEMHDDYEAFVEKFKPKLTTDDCITPPEIYDTVVGWVNDRIMPLGGLRIVRPFWPGEDFTARDYAPDEVVVDNPPFSILKKIVEWYTARGVRFFLFGPGLTLFGRPFPGVTYIVSGCHITYENGASLPTGFVTNMQGEYRIMVSSDLYRRLRDCQEKLKKATSKPPVKRVYPDEVVTSALLNKIPHWGVGLNVPFGECRWVSGLDNMKGNRVRLYGNGYLLSERMAAERMAAERMAGKKSPSPSGRGRWSGTSDRAEGTDHRSGPSAA